MRTRTPGIISSIKKKKKRMFQTLDSSLPCQKEKRKRGKKKKKKRTLRGAFVEAGCSWFPGELEGRCYKVIGVSVKCENKVSVT